MRRPVSDSDYVRCPACGLRTSAWGRWIRESNRMTIRNRFCECGETWRVAIVTITDNPLAQLMVEAYHAEAAKKSVPIEELAA